MTDLALDTRTDLPDALRVLLAEYPRDLRRSHRNFAGLVAFRLDRHLMFRRLAGLLRDDVRALLDRRIGAGAWTRLTRAGGALLSERDGHHWIEDARDFPALAKPRPAR
jgi:hypothetical protein